MYQLKAMFTRPNAIVCDDVFNIKYINFCIDS